MALEYHKLSCQNSKTNIRKLYSKNLATVQKTRDTNLASAAKYAAVTEAGYQAQADLAFTSGQESDWRTQTLVDNNAALLKAQTDVSLWSAEEAANGSGAQALDAYYATTSGGQTTHLPWTAFLVAEA